MAKLQVGIIGLGKFGLELGRQMMERGQEVLGIDADMDKVTCAKDELSQVFQADATNPESLAQLRVKDLDHVVISTGSSMERSLIIALHLKELGVDQIWAKAVNDEHKRILTMIGVNFVIIPEFYAAKFIAGIMD